MKSGIGVYEDRGSSLEELEVRNTILGDLMHSYPANQLPLFQRSQEVPHPYPHELL